MNNNEHATAQKTMQFPAFIDIPEALKSYNQWVCLNHEKDSSSATKLNIIDYQLSATDAYQQCLDQDCHLAFQLTQDDPFALIEYQNAKVKGKNYIDPFALYIKYFLDSYCQLTPSLSTHYAEDFSSIVSIDSKKKYRNINKDRTSIYIDNKIIPIFPNISENTEIKNCSSRFKEVFFLHSSLTLDEIASCYKNQCSNNIKPELVYINILSEFFSLDNWDSNYHEINLHQFLADCWHLSECREIIYRRIQKDRWTREQRQAFEETIQKHIPNIDKKNNNKTENNVKSESWEEDLQLDAKNRVKENFFNMSIILQHHHDWENRFRFDIFRYTPMDGGSAINDESENRIAEWLGYKYGFGGNHPKLLSRATISACRLHEYDSLLEWVEQLPEWDQTPRLETWMIDMCGAEETDYTRWVSKVTMLQMVSRAIDPGCIARLVPIWKGPENRGKSAFIAMLGGEWATTFKISMDSKEAHIAIQGYLLAELEELDTLYKTSETRLKAFLTNTVDTYVPKYANHTVSYPRRTVFIGTTNDDNFLKGVTGNTRFLPVGVSEFRFSSLEENRLQLFSEAKHILKNNPGLQWWQEPAHISDVISEARDESREINVFEDLLSDFLDANGEYSPQPYRTQTDWQDLGKHFLKLESAAQYKDKSLQMQITQALRALGWTRSRIGKKRIWVRPGNSSINLSGHNSSEIPF